MKVEDLISKVRLIINDIAGSCPSSFEVETDFALDNFIMDAMIQLAAMPGLDGLSTTQEDTESIKFTVRPDGMVYATIKTSGDMLRLVSVWLEGWAYPVYKFLPADGTRFLSQYSSAPGIGAGENSPVVFVTSNREQGIIAHAVKTEGKYKVEYVPKPQLDKDNNIVFPDKYKEALAYTAAGLYLQSVNEYDGAKVAFDTSASIIQTLKLN